MKNSIEAIWKEGFLRETTLATPKVNDLYNQKSMLVVDRMIRKFRINLFSMLVMAVIFPVIYYFLGVFWQGLAAAILLLFTAWYTQRFTVEIKSLDLGVSSLEYLKSVDEWLEQVLGKCEKIARILYPLYFLIAYSTIWTTFDRHAGVLWKLQEKYPQSTFINNISIVALIAGALGTLLIYYISGKLYRLDVGLMFGGVFRKLKSTIGEMEMLREG